MDQELEATTVFQPHRQYPPVPFTTDIMSSHPELCFLSVQAALLLRGSWGEDEARVGEGRKILLCPSTGEA